MQVIKRDKKKEPFQISKIENAVKKAFESCGKETDNSVIDCIKSIYDIESDDSVDVEDIQDNVENCLMGIDKEVAKSYIIVRNERAKARDFKYNKKYYSTILELLSGKKNDVSKENANKDPRQFFTMRDLVAGETCKKIYKDFIMDKKLLRLHNKGAVHVHDLDYRAMKAMTNCSLINLKDMLLNGTCIQGKLIHDIHSLQVAVTVTTQIIAAVGSSQYGGISVNLSHLSPFVAKSKEKYEKLFDGINEKDSLVDSFLRKEIVDAMQTFQYQLNSLTTTNGQSPFITVSCYTNDEDDEYKDYTAMLIEEFLKQRIKGMEGPNGNNINPSFPKIIYILAENNMKKDSKYYYLTELAAECTSKRMVPDYISEKVCREYKEGRVFPSMGCVDKDEVVTYEYCGERYFCSIKRMWDVMARIFEVKKQKAEDSYYIDLSGVTIYDSSKNSFVECKRMNKNADKGDWMTVKISNGRVLTCTKDHPLAVVGKGRTYVEDIEIGDEIECTTTIPTNDSEIDADYAWFLGIMLSVGEYDNIVTATFSEETNNCVIDRYIKVLEDTLKCKTESFIYNCLEGRYIDVNTCESIEQAKLSNNLYNLFLDFSYNNRKIPDEIMNASRKTKLHFIGGMIDANGDKTEVLELKSKSKEIALLQIELLNSIGYDASMSEYKYDYDGSSEIGYKVNFNYDNELLGYITTTKKKKNHITKNDLQEEKHYYVNEIKDLGFRGEYSYDVTTESDRFDVSGIISHNCRSMLSPWKDENGNYKEWGRFNIGVMSINLPYLALESKTVDEFLEKLDEYVDYLSEQQHKVYKTICDSPVDIAPILWMYGGFTRAKSGSKIGDILPKGYCTASIGYIGLAETCYRFGVEYPTREGQELGLKIMSHFYDRVKMNAEKYELSLSIYGTPSENTTTTFAKALKKFKRMKHVNDKPYVTNSYHIPVWYKIDGFSKIDFEAPFQKYSQGGAISYVEMPDVNHNKEAVLSVMKHIYDKMLYCEMNTTSCDVCYDCGYHGEIEMLGNNEYRCPNCGNTNSLTLYVQRRLCGYLGTLTNGTSEGREGDIADRVKHF